MLPFPRTLGVAILLIAGCAPTYGRQADSLLHRVHDAEQPAVLDDLIEDAADRDRERLAGISWTTAVAWRNAEGPRARTRVERSAARWRLRIVSSRDPGEPWLRRMPGALPRLPDVGGYLDAHPRPFVRVTVGDFRLEQGIGLLAARPAFGRFVDDPFGRSGTSDAPDRFLDPVHPYSGADGVRRYSGAAVGIRSGRWAVTGFETVRNPAPVATRGASASVEGRSVGLSGMVAVERATTPTALPSRTPSDSFLVRRTQSLAVRARLGGVRWTTEVARVGSRTAIAAFVRYRGAKYDLVAGWRRAAPGYSPVWASGPSFRTGAPGNESGLTIALHRRGATGPNRVAWDRGCRIIAEDRHASGGCTDALRADARWGARERSLEVRFAHDRLRDADTASGRAPTVERTTVTATARLPVARTGSLTASLTARAVREGSRVARSSRSSLRLSWIPRAGWRLQAGGSDVHAEGQPLAVYEPGPPLTASIRTVGGDETSAFLSVVRIGERASYGFAVSARRTLRLPAGPIDAPRRGLSVSLFAAIDPKPIERR